MADAYGNSNLLSKHMYTAEALGVPGPYSLRPPESPLDM
jgi:hypothetical protein